MKKLVFPVAATVLLMLTSASLTFAGGWSVTTLDRVPTNVVVGEPVAVGFTILQHGRTPWTHGEDVQVRATHTSGETMTVRGKPEGAPGHYTASMTFTKPGAWKWAIASGLLPEWQPMPDLTVQEAITSDDSKLVGAPASQALSTQSTNAGTPLSIPLVVGIVGLIGSSGGLIYWLRQRAR